MFSNGITIGIISPPTNNGGGTGEPQSLSQVLKVGDRPVKIISEENFPNHSTNVFELVEEDRQLNVVIANLYVPFLNYGKFPANSELHITNIHTADTQFQTSEKIHLQVNGVTYTTPQTIAIPKGTKVIVKFIKATGEIHELWSVTFEFGGKQEAIYDIEYQNENFVNVVQKSNSLLTNFQFVRKDVGIFKLSNFDSSKHFFSYFSKTVNATLDYNIEDDVFRTKRNNVVADFAFDTGLIIKIEKI